MTKDNERLKEDLRRAAEGSCLCLGYPPACESCVARTALATIEKLEKSAVQATVRRMR